MLRLLQMERPCTKILIGTIAILLLATGSAPAQSVETPNSSQKGIIRDARKEIAELDYETEKYIKERARKEFRDLYRQEPTGQDLDNYYKEFQRRLREKDFGNKPMWNEQTAVSVRGKQQSSSIIWGLVMLGGILILIGAFWYYSRETSDRKSHPGQEVAMSHSRGESNTQMVVPDSFNEQLIQHDLARLAATPNLFHQYVAQLRMRFTKDNQIKVIEKYLSYYQTATKVVKAAGDLKSAHQDYHRLDLEDDVKRTEREARLAELDADKEEHMLRKDQAARRRKSLTNEQSAASPKSADEQNMEAAQRRARLYIRHKVELKAGEKFYTLAELQRWRKDKRHEVRNDLTLTEDEQDALFDQIEETYQDQIRTLKANMSLYEEE